MRSFSLIKSIAAAESKEWILADYKFYPYLLQIFLGSITSFYCGKRL